MRENKKYIAYILLFIVIFVLIFLLNHFTLYTSDDFVYRFIYRNPIPDGHEVPVRNIGDLFHSQINHWRVWNGRFTGHSIVQIFMQFDKTWFNLFNSFAFVSLVVLLNRLSLKFTNTKTKGNSTFYLIITFLMLWWFLPEIGKSVLWVSGSGNYLWTMLIDLVWLLLFIRKQDSPYLLFITLPLAFFAGAGNENTSPSIILLLGLFWLYRCFDEKKIDLLKFLELLVASLGFFLMLLSPGSQKRAGSISIFSNLFEKVNNLTDIAFQKYSILYIVLIAILLYLIVKKYINKSQLLILSMIFLAHLACIYSLVASNELPDRIFFGSSVLLILSVLLVLRLLFLREQRVQKLALICLVPFLVKFGFSYSNAITDIYSTYEIVTIQYQEIEKAKEEYREIVVLRRYPQPRTLFNAYNGTANLGPSKDDWFNKWMAAYFGVEGIESVD